MLEVFIMFILNFAYPQTKSFEVYDTLFGVEIVDPYRWLENVDEPEVKKWIEEQNNMAIRTLKSVNGYKKLYREIKRYSRRRYLSLPSVYKDRYFFYKFDGKSNHSALYMSIGKWNHKKARKVIDPNKFSKDGLTAMDFTFVSLDGKYIAFGKSFGGSESSTLYILDVDRNVVLPESIPDTKWTSVAWLPDNSGFYYTRNVGEDRFLPRIYFHRLGSDVNSDEYVFGEGLPDTYVPSISITRDGRFLILTVNKSWSQNDLFVKKVGEDGDWMKIAENLDGTFSLKSYGNYFYILTNYKAPNYRLLKVPIEEPSVEKAMELIPESNWILEGFSFAGGKLIFEVTESTFTRFLVGDLEGNVEHEITLPRRGSAYFSVENYESPLIYINFHSFLYPTTIFRYDVNSREMEKIWQEKVSYKTGDFVEEFVLYTSKDGTKVPMHIVHRRDIKFDGQNPTLLTGYGGFGVAMTPAFLGEDVLLKRGFVFAVACLRGGNEFGEEWHRQGMRDKKQNVFDDFIAAAEYLIKSGYTNPEKLAISGGSNGGLLVGAVMVQRPELFRVVYCGVPLLDMLRYHKFGVAHIWIPEYGNPDDPNDFKYLLEYSPYHRIDREREKVFPSVFFHAAEFDGRVHPMHAMKMAAKMQNNCKVKGPVLLYVEPAAGHGAGKPRKKRIEDNTLKSVYILWQLGVKI
ncbi:MAG TPA: prolyl oligopeptidase family serine peptidase [Candidatus Hydrothermia bacterium]|nr:prolyl oligopeptidase family serine peptidase [Candidatus Hydrothermia bacterium]MDD5573359.1 prolyl oligopeptidase family serine peptidase [Candidatus Hydrothermia bacterium]HOK23407.1 prolyl oligopeptidase family serine peptidase [Candidatus Hydrothermia bacterium]HOL23997.1 prolyl oligopeptidase family serine peptidase [Candidatus Hydrothermia bacterium]HPO79166.1 prolyl oligopeptidase family serine peptidase [Candidatus Hydrothermia bacterium]